MAAGDQKIEYASSTAFTLTNLHSCGASATHVAGWESNEVDNSTNKYEDYFITGELKVAASSLAVGKIQVAIVAEQSDSAYPDVFDGTESEPETVTSVEIYNAICMIGAVIATTTDADRVYPFGPFSVAELFGGVCPRKFVVFITQSTTQALAASANLAYYKGIYSTVAQ